MTLRIQVLSLLAALPWAACRQVSETEALLGRAARADPRPVEGRLSTSPGYAPWSASPPARNGSLLPSGSHRLRTSGERHASGLLQLHLRNPFQAVEALERAVGERPTPETLSDLSAAYHALAAMHRPWLLVDSLVAASRAVRAAPDDPAGAFNLALALDALSLSHVAQRAWRRYLDLEADPSWRAEGAARLARIETLPGARSWKELEPSIQATGGRLDLETVERLVLQSPFEVRRMLETEWLPAAAAAIGKPDMNERLGVATLWSGAFARNGDPFYAAVLASLQKIPGRASRRIEDGLRLYAEGLRNRSDCSRAEPLFTGAEARLGEAKNPMAWAARLERLVCLYRRLPLVAEPFLTELAGEVAPYPDLTVKVERVLGLCAMTNGRYSLAISHYQQAVKRLAPDDLAGHAFLEGMLDEANRFLGDRNAMWGHRLLALRAVAELGDFRLRHTVLSGLARELSENGRHEAAIPVLDELIANARTWSEPGAEAETLLRLFQLDLVEGKRVRAADIERCRRLVPLYPQPADRAKVALELQIVSAERDLEARPTEARKALRSALRELSANGEGVLLPRALLLLARADLALGDLQGAEEAFRRILGLYEDRRAFAEDENQRIQFFETAQASFDAMIRFQAVERNDAQAALRYAEQARARGLRDRLAVGRAASPLADFQLDTLLGRLPQDVAAIEFAVLPDRLLAWRFYRRSLAMFSVPLSRTEVARIVASQRANLESEEPAERGTEAVGGAFESLLAPMVRDLPSGTDLVLVPDRELYRLAFGALFDRKRSRFLIEDYAILVTPSLGTYLASLDRPRRGKLARVLSVGDPAFDRGAFPGLATLPSARKEARSIAEGYPESTLLLGRAASRSAILAALPESDVVHLAAHVLVDPREPLASVVATADPEGAALRTSNLDDRTLAGVDLIFLSACDTAPGFPDGDREGVAGLARAFLASGVSSVVATLWPVKDRAISGLPELFHARLRAGDSPARALQRAQVGLLRRSGSGAREWAAFQVFSGG